MLPGSPMLALRLCCKQLKWEIDHLVGLEINMCVDEKSESDCKSFDWIKHILIRKLTIQRYGYLTVPSPWISFLTNGDFIHLNRLSLFSLNNLQEGDLARILTALSTLSSLSELNFSLIFGPGDSQDNSISSISTLTEKDCIRLTLKKKVSN